MEKLKEKKINTVYTWQDYRVKRRKCTFQGGKSRAPGEILNDRRSLGPSMEDLIDSTEPLE